MTETSFATEIIRWAKTYGWKVHHVRNSGFGGNSFVQGDKGFPDLLCVRDDDWIAAELKTGKATLKRNQPRPEQVAWLDALRRLGANAVVWRPENWSQILATLARSK